ncbi:MAG: hypothetical protein ABSA70_16860, partial [Terriglobia bacterium]
MPYRNLSRGGRRGKKGQKSKARFLTGLQACVTVSLAPQGTSLAGNSMAEILKIDPARLEFILDYSTRMILAGKVVAVPTDT